VYVASSSSKIHVTALRVAAGQLIARPMRPQQAVRVAAKTGGYAIDRLLPLHLRGQEVRRFRDPSQCARA
jgi:hypothetical protein